MTVLLPSAALVEAANWNATWGSPGPDRENGPAGTVVTPAGIPESVKLIVPVNPFKKVA